ncbi:MAG: hypothetical protein ACE5I8_10810, partial [Thermodesulfobacteriota bacterium]
EELKREYSFADTKGRIRLLKRLEGYPPFEIAQLAIADESAEVRQWIARHGQGLDYRKVMSSEEKNDSQSDPLNLWEKLEKDPDPFVRACLRENPNYRFPSLLFSNEGSQCFKNSTHMERLALVRNERVPHELIEKIFDHDDSTLNLSAEEREELVLAFLTNEKKVRESRKTRREYDAREEEFSLIPPSVENKLHYSKLWKLASKWPGTEVRYFVYGVLGTDDETKAEVYRNTNESRIRSWILDKCSGDDILTIRLGMQDPNEECREGAFRVWDLSRDLARALLTGLNRQDWEKNSPLFLKETILRP